MHKCELCSQDASPVFDVNGNIEHYYCQDHTFDQNYCWGCGYPLDCVVSSGLCSKCNDVFMQHLHFAKKSATIPDIDFEIN